MTVKEVIHDLRETLELLRNENKHSKEELETLSSKVQQLKQQAKELQTELIASQEEQRELTYLLNDLIEESERLRRSTSWWKIATPIAMIVGLVLGSLINK